MNLLTMIDGTLLNAATVAVGGTVGVLVGNWLPERVHEALFGVLGLFTLLVGLLNALPSKNVLLVLGCLLLGAALGAALDLDGAIQRGGTWVQKRLGAGEGSTLSEAFVTTSIIFCVGPLTILGSLDNGLTGDTTKLVIKALLDGFAALAFGSALGWGVLLSVGTILVVQGGISLAAGALAPVLTRNPETLLELTAVGGVILLAIGFKLLKIRDLRPANYLPALVLAPLLVAALDALHRAGL